MTTSSIVTIAVGSPNWIQKANKAIDQNRHIKIVVKGPEASTAATALSRGIKATTQSAISEGVVITAVICITIIAVVGLGTVAAVCLYGISQGYKVKAKHAVHGPWPFDDELEFDLVPPAA